jgi:hypothetical protein
VGIKLQLLVGTKDTLMKDESEIIEIKTPNLQMQAANQQIEAPSAMLVLHSQKQND